MKIKPAILFLLPSATASGLAVSTLSGYGTAWPSNSSPGAKGLQTGSRTFVVGDGSSFSAEAVYYDWRSQPIQKHCIDHQGMREDLFLNLSFTGRTVASRKVVTPSGGAATVVTMEMSYDGWDRLAGEVTTVSGGGADATDRVTYSYDDVGRMTGRTYGEPGSAGSTAETLSYNAKGWLTGQASPVYSSTLRYTDPSRTSTAGRYGGSISEWSWSRGSGSGMQTYAFSYDGLDRLTGSKRYIGSSTVATDAFTEQGLEYDRNGNIKALVRYGQGAADPEDDLLFTLSGNRIWSISNSGSNGSGKTYSAFAYDANGNTTHDGRTGQDLVWNALNLLSGATVTEGGVTSTLATYTWLADGTKYSTERPDGSGYVYKGELIYTKAPGGALTLDCVLTTGGRIVAERDADGTLSGYSVRHHIRDHLGSVRAVTDGSTGEVLETSDYLPFGTRWALTGGTQGATSTITDPSNRWRYSGKEEQQALSPALSLLDYGARMYDPTLARWLTPDPLAEKYMQWSPYGYCIGNPIRMTDDGGLDIVLTGRESSSVTIKTDLLDLSFNVSGLGINWGGNYTLEGDKVLSAALDIAGYFDPTGIADGANATLLVSQGNYLGALQSVAGALVPYIGDVAKAPRLGHSIETLYTAVNLGKAETRAVENVVTFRKFTKGNFRVNLSRMTGVNPSGMEAHHTIPVKFEDQMNDLGVIVHDPKYGAWLPKDKHRKTAYEYNKRWESLLEKKDLSIKDIERFAKDLMKELYGKE